MHPKEFFRTNPSMCEPQTCFVVMPFDKQFDPIYEAIKAAVIGPRLGFLWCRRADDLLGGKALLDDVLLGIARAEIVVADLTTRNPNVFYELGIAHAAKDEGKVIVLTQSLGELPADLRHLRCVLYEPNEAGRDALQQQLVHSIHAVTAPGLRFSVSSGTGTTFPDLLRSREGRYYEFTVGPL